VNTPSRDSIFCAAVEIQSPSERAAFVERACGDDTELRQEVQKLVEAHFHAGSFLEQPAAALNVTGPFVPAEGDGAGALAEGPGSRIGPYKLLQLLGEGGMGAVWMAEQTEPVHRRVAVKVIKPGMDTAQVVARFEAERQALALMDHPNIAKVLDAGSTASGRPFFVMELVKGTPMTQYCDEHKLTPRQRLELFVPVCQAIQHAHQKGIIHRDIKPSNVLIAPYDGRPMVKVIDFGIAKAMGQQLTERTLFTAFGAVIGTPEYMSPEQAELNNQDIDTRSDVYSLGVLLYELLTGTPPLRKEQFQHVTFLEVLRMIREEETPLPSVRVSTSQTLPTVAARRGVQPAQLMNLLRGELDWIVLKALDKDRKRRYETADGFALDIQRYLADEPVQACPPSASYRLRKFLRKHRRALSVALVIVVAALISTSAGVWWLLKKAEIEHEETVKRATAEMEARVRREATEREVEAAVQEAKRLQKQKRWAEGLSAVRRAELLLSREESADTFLVSSVARVKADLQMVVKLEDVPMQYANAVLLQVVPRWDGRPQESGGKLDFGPTREAYARAFAEYGMDLATCTVAETADRIEVASIRDELMRALDFWLSIKPLEPKEEKKIAAVMLQLSSSGPWCKEIVTWMRTKDRAALEKMAGRPEVESLPTRALCLLSLGLHELGAFSEAVEALRTAQRHDPSDYWVHRCLGFLLIQGQPPRWQDAAICFRVGVALRPSSAVAHFDLGMALSMMGDVRGAAAAFARSGELLPSHVLAHVCYGNQLVELGKIIEAEAAYRKALQMGPNQAAALTGLGLVLMQQNKPAEALPLLEKAVGLGPALAEAHINLGKYYEAAGKRDTAFRHYQKALEVNPNLAEAHNNVGSGLMSQGKFEEGLKHFRKAVELKPAYALAQQNCGTALMQLNRMAEAEAAWRKALELDASLGQAHNNLGAMLARRGDFTEAVKHLRKAVELMPTNALCKKSLQEAELQLLIGEGAELANKHGKWAEAEVLFRKALTLDARRAKVHFNLGNVLAQQSKLSEAEACYKRAIELRPDLPPFYYNLAHCFQRQNKLSEAEAAFRKAIKLQPDHAAAYCNLGGVLASQEKLPEAEAALRKAIQIDPALVDAHHCLGTILFNEGKAEGALVAIRKALELQPDRATAHCDLGHVLLKLGRPSAALAAFRRGHELGTRTPGWGLPSADWVKAAEHFVKLEGRLPSLLLGEAVPRDNEERLTLVDLCRTRKLHAAAAGLYAEALARDPRLADDWRAAHRYHAACQAALAGSRVGDDAAKLEDRECARLRRQALDWLRASLEAYRKLLTSSPGERPAIAAQLQQWLQGPGLAVVRDPSPLGKLPEAERGDWQRLWEEVKALAQQARH
jgi:tetratricopeptide (TPR) repeat protein/serine/threonine protein kinase